MRLGNRRRQTILLDDESETEEDEPDNRLLVSGSAELFFFQLYEPFAQNLYKIFSKILNLHKNQLAYAN